MKKLILLMLSAFVFSINHAQDAEIEITLDSSYLYQYHNRALSMGNAFVSVVPTGETAMNYNSAGLASKREADFVWESLIGIQTAYDPNLVNELQEKKDRDVEDTKNLIDRYKNATHVINAQGWGHFSLQWKIDSPVIQRFGIGTQKYTTVLAVLSFPTLENRRISLDDPKETTKQISDTLEKEFDRPLSDEEKKKLEENLEKLKDDERVKEKREEAASDPRIEEKEEILNDVWTKSIDMQVFRVDIETYAAAISILDDSLKLGYQTRRYELLGKTLDRYPLIRFTSGDSKPIDSAITRKANWWGHEIGLLYSLESEGTYQFGATYQNIGGQELEGAALKIPSTLNVGMSYQYTYDFLMMLGALELKDIEGSTTYVRGSETYGRSWEQRSHLGLQLGLFPIATPDEYLFYFSAGMNQMQPTYGVQVNVPFHIMRVGFSNYGADLGDTNESQPYKNQQIFVSLGFSI